MPDTIFDFEAMRAAGTTFAFATDGTDWIFINWFYAAVPFHSGPSITLQSVCAGQTHAYAEVFEVSGSYQIDFLGIIENARGSASADNISGSTGANILVGDPTDAFGGSDVIRADDGDDTIYGIGNDDFLYGDNGNDLIFGDRDPQAQDQGNFAPGSDAIYGGFGNDTMVGGPGNYTLNGGDDYDTVSYAGLGTTDSAICHLEVNLATGDCRIYGQDTGLAMSGPTPTRRSSSSNRSSAPRTVMTWSAPPL